MIHILLPFGRAFLIYFINTSSSSVLHIQHSLLTCPPSQTDHTQLSVLANINISLCITYIYSHACSYTHIHILTHSHTYIFELKYVNNSFSSHTYITRLNEKNRQRSLIDFCMCTNFIY